MNVQEAVTILATYSTKVLKNLPPGWAQWVTPVIPTLWAAEARESPEVRSSRAAWPIWRNPVSTKNTKISQAWWHLTVAPATQEAEKGKLLEPGRWRLQWAKIAALQPGTWQLSKTLSQKKKKEMWYIYTMEYYSAIKEEWDSVISNNMDGTGGHNLKWNKSGTEKQTSHILTYLWQLKIKTIECTEIESRRMFTRSWEG